MGGTGVEPDTVFLVGLPRSGSTLLSFLLAGIPDSLTFSEPYLAQDILPQWLLRRYFRRIERSVGLARVRVPRPCSPAALLEHMKHMATVNRLRYLIVKETYRCTREWQNAHLLERLAEQGERFIAIHRHPYDIAVSSIKFCRWWRGIPGHLIRLVVPRLPLFPTDHALVEHCTDNWVNLVTWCRRRGVGAVRYEDLVVDPERALRSLCGSACLPFHEAMLDYTHPRSGFGGIGAPEVLNRGPRPVNTASVGRKHLLRPELIDIIASRCRSVIGDLGYEL